MRSVLKRAGVLTDVGVGHGGVEPADDVDRRSCVKSGTNKYKGIVVD